MSRCIMGKASFHRIVGGNLKDSIQGIYQSAIYIRPDEDKEMRMNVVQNRLYRR